MSKQDTNILTDAEASSQWITATLIGGPHDQQMIRVPADEWMLQFTEYGTAHKYLRTGTAPLFRHQGALAALLGGGK